MSQRPALYSHTANGPTTPYRSTEVKAIASLLEQEHEDVDTLAKAVIAELDRLRAEKPFHILVIKDGPNAVIHGYGPFTTPLQAGKAWESGQYSIHPDAQAMCLKVWTPEHKEEMLAVTDAPVPRRTVDELPVTKGR